MSRRFASMLCCAAVALVALRAFAQQPSIVGTWEWTRKSNGCTERYTFRDDGTVSVTSADALTQGTYLMAWAPEPTGRYRMTMTIAKREGGKDCRDAAATETQGARVRYVLFGGSHATMIICDSPEGADCAGPLHKRTP